MIGTSGAAGSSSWSRQRTSWPRVGPSTRIVHSSPLIALVGGFVASALAVLPTLASRVRRPFDPAGWQEAHAAATYEPVGKRRTENHASAVPR